MRKLPEYYRFNIEIKKFQGYPDLYPRFTDTEGIPLPDYKSKLTPSQWTKASKYLDRKLRPFIGYYYQVKPEFKKVQIIKIV